MFGVQLFLYEALGLCAEGKGDTLVDSAKWITNDQGSNKQGHFACLPK